VINLLVKRAESATNLATDNIKKKGCNDENSNPEIKAHAPVDV